ncbi:hypothetical protein AB0G73_28285 [Streptomyces sp. NPDC020719]|uniref:hypothetical protein n=1 Tax=Streptomyces sp. NPDC020719 TaxID=3154896 RepID=UPI0033FDE8F9
MIIFHTYNELYGTVYAHRPTTAADGQDRRVREAWYGELIQQRRDEQRMSAGWRQVEQVTHLTVWPGRLSGHMPIQNADSLYVVASPSSSPRPLDVFWPRLSGEQWLLLAATARSHAHQLATGSSHDAMLRILDLTDSLDMSLLPGLSEIRSTDCPCRSRKKVCEHVAALIECYARTLVHEPLTLLLLAGCAPTDFFAIVDDPGHPSAQPHYRPESLVPPTTDARALFYRRQWHTTGPLPPLSARPAEPAAPGPPATPGDPAHQLLARCAADHATDLLRQAARRSRNPVTDPIRRLTPEQDAARLAACHTNRGGTSSPA